MRRRLLILVAVLGLAACGGSRLPGGQSVAYTPGLPDFDLGAVPILEGDSTALDALVSIPRVSLVFVRDTSGFRAVTRTALSLRHEDGRLTATVTRRDTIRVATFEETLAFDPSLIQQRLEAPPGSYRLLAEVEDAATGRLAIRSLPVSLPSLDEPPSLGPARLDAIAPDAPDFRPLVSLSVPADLDSFRVRMEVFNAPGPLDATARLLRLAADTSVAEPPSGFSPSGASLAARGVNARRPDTVFVSRQRIPAPAPALTLEQPLPTLDPGVYALRLRATPVGADEAVDETERVFVVRPPGFPRLVGLADFVGPVRYLASPREMADLLGAPPDSLRQVFDAFWGSRFQDRRIAEATFRAFYERVEEANRLFSNHKDGWRTDRGMIYILFGPPERTENRFDSEVWIYGASQPLGTVVFQRTARRERDRVPYDVFVLQRDRAFDAAWRRVLRQWRAGQVP
ncbi:MAG: GWxTD domain-containing protein [Bacteroidota bacterium]